MHNILIAIILGIVEGVTEFLPISSTGHLIVAERLLHFKDVQDMFTVIIQLGAIAAVVWFYRKDLFEKIWGLFKRDGDALHFWKILIIGTIPAALIGLAVEKSLDKFATPKVVAISLIVGGIVLWIVDRKPATPRDRHKEFINFNDLSVKQSALIGLGQSVAIIPGVSRSGATIVSGLLTGLNRPTATAFSFYLSIPVLVMASGLKLVKHSDVIPQLSGGMTSLAIGLVVSFITALMSVSWLLHYISRHNFRPFAYYRVIAGLAIIGLLAARII
jgi:undecaprenyl-diphosphatase